MQPARAAKRNCDLDYFTVCFDNVFPRESGSLPEDSSVRFSARIVNQTEAILLALRGVSLREAIRGICEKRAIHLDRVCLFLEFSNTPLPWETDTSFLAGHKLIAKPKQDDRPFSKRPLYSKGINAEINSQGLQNVMKVQSNGVCDQNSFKSHIAPDVPPRKESLTIGNTTNDRKLSFGSVMNKRRMDSNKVINQLDTLSIDKQDIDSCSNGNPGQSSDTASLASHTSAPVSEYSRKERSKSQGRLSQIFPYPFRTCDRIEMLERLTNFQEHSLFTASNLMQNEPDMAWDEEVFLLEEKWQDIVKDRETLTRKHQEQQEVLWELISTELNYIKKLCSIVELQNNVQSLQSDGLLQDVEREHIFGNILDIARSNLRFWANCLRPLLAHSRQTGRPLDPIRLEVGFENVHNLFEPYVVYCLRHVDTLCYVRRKQKESELFKEFAMWVQSRRFFGRLHLADLLAKPMQRLTKYPLLLKAILKCTADHAGKESLCRMIDITEEFASKVNIELCRKQHFDALVCIMQCIDSYEAVETANDELDKFVKEYSYFDLTAPMPGCKPKLMRQLILRGELKFREAYSKVDVICFLFTDMFMICKSLSKKGERHRLRIIRPLYHLDRIIVRPLKDTTGFACLCLNEFHVPYAASIFITHSQEETTKWLEHIHIAKDEYCRLRNCDDYLSAMKCTTGARGKFNVESTFSPSMALTSNAAAPSSRKSSASGLLTPVLDANGAVVGLSPQTNVALISRALTATAATTSGKNRSASPLRRISVGAADNGQRKKVDMVDHRKCISIDSSNLNVQLSRKLSSSVLCAASLGMYSLGPLHCSDLSGGNVDPVESPPSPLAPQNSTLSPLNRAPSPLLEVAAAPKLSPSLKDSHSSSCIADQGDNQRTLTPIRFDDQTSSSMLNIRTSSVDLIKRLSPTVKRKSWQATTNEKLAVIEAASALVSEKNAVQMAEQSPNLKSSDRFEAETASIASSSASASGASGCQVARRLERRYHTADAIEDLKPPPSSEDGAVVGTILKRFSWSTPATTSTVQRRCKKLIIGPSNFRPSSAATPTSASGSGVVSLASSICSTSSSGVSSGSLAGRFGDGASDSTLFADKVLFEQTLREESEESGKNAKILPRLSLSEPIPDRTDLTSDTNNSSTDSNYRLQHVSKITIESDWSNKDSRNHVALENKTNNSNNDNKSNNNNNGTNYDETEEENIILEAQDMVKAPYFMSNKAKMAGKSKSSVRDDLLRFIMESNLESSDV